MTDRRAASTGPVLAGESRPRVATLVAGRAPRPGDSSVVAVRRAGAALDTGVGVGVIGLLWVSDGFSG